MSSPIDPGSPYGSDPYRGQQENGHPNQPSNAYPVDPAYRGQYQHVPSQPYGQPVYVQTDNGNNTSLAPVTSLVTGLFGFFTAWIPLLGIVAWVLGPLAILFGVLGLRRGKTEHKIMSILGIITGAIALAICFGYVLLLASVSSSS